MSFRSERMLNVEPVMEETCVHIHIVMEVCVYELLAYLIFYSPTHTCSLVCG